MAILRYLVLDFGHRERHSAASTRRRNEMCHFCGMHQQFVIVLEEGNRRGDGDAREMRGRQSNVRRRHKKCMGGTRKVS